jgi:hypothetical protein
MNKLILIGNGFDLAHGLKTSYKDFLLWYLNALILRLETSKNISDEIIEVTAPYTIKFNDGKPFNTIPNLQESLTKHNVRLKYKSDFVESIFKAYRASNWVDIEYFYYRSLVSVFDAQPLPKILDNGYFNIVALINNNLGFLAKKLVEYLKSEVIGSAKINPVISHMFSEITGANNSGNKTIVNHPQNTLILNFNYTKTINLYDVELGLKTSRSKMINIHGEIYSNNNPIIFGYGDEMDPDYPRLENLNMNRLLDNIKSFHYFITSNYKALSSFINSGNPFTVYILGHSCGISDRVLLNKIFEHKDCQKIKIYYHQREDGTSDYFEKTQEISRHFMPETKDIMRERIVSFDKCEPLT